MTLLDIRRVEVSGKRVLLRASLNVPVQDGKVLNDFRIRRAIPTIEHLRNNGAITIIIAHIGRNPHESLREVHEILNAKIPCTFVQSVDLAMAATKSAQPGDVFLIENLRRDPGEVDNDDDFVRNLADLAELYVNDSFAAAHRMHASVVGVPELLPSYAGMSLINEVEQLSHAQHPEKPALFVLGGAKFATKLPLIEKCLEQYDKIFVGGALATDFFKAKGYEVGTSLVSDDTSGIKMLLKDPRIVLPHDVVVENDGVVTIKKPEDVLKDDNMVDVGPESIQFLEDDICEAKFILWNGPMGKYEGGFADQTETLAYLIANAPGDSVVGGGDSVATVNRLKLEDRFTFVSTGGGSMLQYLADGTLPGIELVSS